MEVTYDRKYESRLENYKESLTTLAMFAWLGRGQFNSPSKPTLLNQSFVTGTSKTVLWPDRVLVCKTIAVIQNHQSKTTSIVLVCSSWYLLEHIRPVTSWDIQADRVWRVFIALDIYLEILVGVRGHLVEGNAQIQLDIEHLRPDAEALAQLLDDVVSVQMGDTGIRFVVVFT